MYELVIDVLEELGLHWKCIGGHLITHGNHGTIELVPLTMVGRRWLAYATDEGDHVGTKALQPMSGDESRDRETIRGIISNIQGRLT